MANAYASARLAWCRAAFASRRTANVDFSWIVGQGTRKNSVGLIASAMSRHHATGTGTVRT
jgi:hypothetical protein